MYTTFSVGVTTAQYQSLQYAALDPQEWVSNAVLNRARIACAEICQIYTNYKMNNEEPITVVGKDAMVSAAFSEGIVKTAKEKNDEFEASLVGIAST
jgi:hypothetical protein